MGRAPLELERAESGAPAAQRHAGGARVAEAARVRRVARTLGLVAVEHPALDRKVFNEAFVTMQYFGYLRRDPDPDGFNFWLTKLNQFNGNYVAAEMVKAFITSDEYKHRFGQ